VNGRHPNDRAAYECASVSGSIFGLGRQTGPKQGMISKNYVIFSVNNMTSFQCSDSEGMTSALRISLFMNSCIIQLEERRGAIPG